MFPADSPFVYRSGDLTCEGVSLATVAAAVGTPVYVYSRAEILARAQTFLATAAEVATNALVCYAVKANGNVHLLRLLGKAGSGADVTSGG